MHGGGAVGQALVESSAGKIFFTGSVEVGRSVGEECARRMKGSVLELGGKDPQIVCADANLANAISGAVWGGFANAGQTCSGIERAYVVGEVADRFIDGVVREASALTVGDPSEWDTEIGPMISQEQFDLVWELVDDAVASGAKRLCGGPVEVPGFEGHFIAPTVLTDVTHDMRIMREEIFGPVLPIMRVRKRGRGDRARERLPVRPRRIRVDARPREGRADREQDRGRHGLGQRPLLHPWNLPVRLGRSEGLGPRPLPFEVRLLRVREHQDGVVGALPHGGRVVATVRRDPRHGDHEPRCACSTGATSSERRRCARAQFRCCE